eukprot:365455-Chlamydomonas_euryale.AAC.20
MQRVTWRWTAQEGTQKGTRRAHRGDGACKKSTEKGSISKLLPPTPTSHAYLPHAGCMLCTADSLHGLSAHTHQTDAYSNSHFTRGIKMAGIPDIVRLLAKSSRAPCQRAGQNRFDGILTRTICTGLLRRCNAAQRFVPTELATPYMHTRAFRAAHTGMQRTRA